MAMFNGYVSHYQRVKRRTKPNQALNHLRIASNGGIVQRSFLERCQSQVIENWENSGNICSMPSIKPSGSNIFDLFGDGYKRIRRFVAKISGFLDSKSRNRYDLSYGKDHTCMT